MKIINNNVVKEKSMRIICLDGKIINSKDFEELEKLVVESVRSEIFNFVLHFKRITTINSTGINSLLNLYKLVENATGKLIIFEADQFIKKVLKITCVDHMINICDSMNEIHEVISPQ
ncbi:MAG: STAS domain-containing protein [Nitrospinae bacterium]|nr:STAS domain-containing protein [Nitrospinota bacterium]